MTTTIRKFTVISFAAASIVMSSWTAAEDGSAIDLCTRGPARGEVIEQCTRALLGPGLSAESRALAYWRRGSALSTAGRLAEAIEDYGRALAISPSFQPAYVSRGAAQFRLGQVPPAIADYDTAIRLDPRDSLAFHNRAVALRAIGENSRAIQDYSEAVRLDRFNTESLIGRGVAYQALEDHPRAVADFTAALRIRPRLASAYSNRGVSHRALGKEDLALQDFEASLRVDPTYGRALVNRGVIRRARGDSDGAFADFDRAVALDEKFAGAFFNRGLAHFERQQFTQASKDFAKAAALQQDAASILWLYLAKGRDGGLTDEALLGALSGNASWPASLAAHLAGSLTQRELLARARSGSPQQRRAQGCEALFFAGQKSLLQHKEIEAAKLLQRAVESCPGDFLEREVAAAELTNLRERGVESK